MTGTLKIIDRLLGFKTFSEGAQLGVAGLQDLAARIPEIILHHPDIFCPPQEVCLGKLATYAASLEEDEESRKLLAWRMQQCMVLHNVALSCLTPEDFDAFWEEGLAEY